MKRVIKFRVWRKEDNEFIYAEPVYGFFPSLRMDEENGNNLEERYGDIQQFTGLLDKNGKEIYEGDVLRDPMGELISEGVFYDEEKAAFYAWWRYETPKNGQRTDRFSGGYISTERLTGCEIIGNIYENPELLKP